MNYLKKEFIKPMSIFLILIIVLISGCTITLPTTWATINDAYPAVPEVLNIESNAGAIRSANFDYTYDEVYNSCVRALSFAQLNILDEARDDGEIYAVRTASGRSSTLRYYYLVDIEELSGEECKVRLYSKVQGTGSYRKWGPSIVAPSLGFLATAVILTATMEAGVVALLFMSLPYPAITVPMNMIEQKKAETQSTLRWSSADDEYLDRIMSFIRTDLLQR